METESFETPDTRKVHPVSTGVGAAGGAATGAAIGAVGGPVGMAVGAAVGAVAGGLIGEGFADSIDPEVEDSYWRENHSRQGWSAAGYDYEDYAPAYRLGYTGHDTRGANWDTVEGDLERKWDRAKGDSRLAWSDAKHAVRGAWHRVEEALPGDADGDGR